MVCARVSVQWIMHNMRVISVFFIVLFFLDMKTGEHEFLFLEDIITKEHKLFFFGIIYFRLVIKVYSLVCTQQN